MSTVRYGAFSLNRIVSNRTNDIICKDTYPQQSQSRYLSRYLIAFETPDISLVLTLRARAVDSETFDVTSMQIMQGANMLQSCCDFLCGAQSS